jgi:ribonuclease Y
MVTLIVSIAAALLGGGAIGFIARQLFAKRAEKVAEERRRELVLAAKEEAARIKESAQRDEAEQRRRLDETEARLRGREESLDNRLESIESDLKRVADERKSLEDDRRAIDALKLEEQAAIEKVAKLKKDEARELLMKQVETEFQTDLVAQVRRQKEVLKEEADVYARKVVATAVQRLATEVAHESTTAAVHLPSDDMKGRIIGKEGRNIQQFERVTGVDVLIDDTPDTVTISCFDPIRRQVAKVALERLIADGRIQPAKIEDVVAKVQEDLEKEIEEAGAQAAADTGVAGLQPDILKILGRLKYRTSFGQNVLMHSIEVGNIAGLLAAEIGAEVSICRKAGLLHDLGKAVDHDVPGAHHHISMDIGRKYGMSEIVLNAIGAHHDDIDPKTVEAILVRVSDGISGGRQGARRDSLENYIKRLTELENIANSFPGVDKSFAIQAGREVRIIVRPQDVDDLGALRLSKDIAKKIEQDMQYPGTIKVNVIREVRQVTLAK